MRPTIEQITKAIKNEGVRHGLLQETVKSDIPPAIAIAGRPRSFAHTVNCKCGYQYELTTQHSGSTQAGVAEFYQALVVEAQEHVATSCAVIIHELYESKQ